jgi:hypothetical protein
MKIKNKNLKKRKKKRKWLKKQINMNLQIVSILFYLTSKNHR